MQNLVWMELAPTVLEWHYWANVFVRVETMNLGIWLHMKIFKYISYEIVPRKESKKIQLVTSQVHAFIYKFMFEQLHFIPYLQKKLILISFCVNMYNLVSSSRNLLKRDISMFSMSTWHNERMRSLEYAEIHFPVVLYF